MSDEILTDKQVESIAKFGRQQGGVTHDCISDLAESHEALRAEVERLEAAAQRWIPVTERLPEEGNRIVTLSNTGFIAAGWRDGKSGLFHRHVEYVDMGDVTHWMPLPAPPPPRRESGSPPRSGRGCTRGGGGMKTILDKLKSLDVDQLTLADISEADAAGRYAADWNHGRMPWQRGKAPVQRVRDVLSGEHDRITAVGYDNAPLSAIERRNAYAAAVRCYFIARLGLHEGEEGR